MNRNLRTPANAKGGLRLQILLIGRSILEIKLNNLLIPVSKFEIVGPDVLEVRLGSIKANNFLSIRISGKPGAGIVYRFIDSSGKIILGSEPILIESGTVRLINDRIRLRPAFGLKSHEHRSFQFGNNLEIAVAPLKETPPGKENIPDLSQKLAEDNSAVTVYFGTNRNVEARFEETVRFGTERSAISYGKCDVHIPKNHRVGEVKRPSWFKIWGRLNPDKYVTILNTKGLSDDEFFRNISTNIDGFASNDAMVFVHGYNVSFESAARQAAQLAYDINFEGIPMLFSWASHANINKYRADEDEIAYASRELAGFLYNIRSRGKVGRIFLVAHSMGNRGLTNALIELMASDFYKQGLIDQVIMAAPDIESDYFVDRQAQDFVRCSSQLTLYAATKDYALIASRTLRSGKPRLGLSGSRLVIVDGIDTIDASNVKTDLLGHGYFSSTAPLINDIHGIVVNGLPPEKRNLDRYSNTNGKVFWKIKLA